jgi:hypothetical protein
MQKVENNKNLAINDSPWWNNYAQEQQATREKASELEGNLGNVTTTMASTNSPSIKDDNTSKNRPLIMLAAAAVSIALVGGGSALAQMLSNSSAGEDTTNPQEETAGDATNSDGINETFINIDTEGIAEHVDTSAKDDKTTSKDSPVQDDTSSQSSAVETSASPSASSNNASSSSATQNTASSTQTTHTHSWVAQTTTVHHAAEYRSVTHDAVKERRAYCITCGADVTSNYTSHKNATGHTSQPRYENVTIQAAYTEQVLVSAAYDETVTTGYKCSACGATY